MKFDNSLIDNLTKTSKKKREEEEEIEGEEDGS